MKKQLCIMLALLLCASLLVSCRNEEEKANTETPTDAVTGTKDIDETSEEAKTETPTDAVTDTKDIDETSEETNENIKEPIYTFNEASDISEIPLVKFTAVANGVESMNMFSVTVDEEYQHIYGKLINIYDTNGQFDYSEICSGDRLEIVPDRIEATTPITIHIKEAKITEASEYHRVNEYGGRDLCDEGWGYIAFTVPVVTEAVIPDYMPDPETLRNFDYEYRFTELSRTSYMRVYAIQDGIVYVSPFYNFHPAYTLVDVSAVEKYSVGDFIILSYTGFYEKKGNGGSYIFYDENISDISPMSQEMVWQELIELNRVDYSATYDKPVIYLYPEEDTECSVKVTMANGKLTCTYPEHGVNGWQNFTACPDGTLIFPDGKQYYCLYWEGNGYIDADFSKGFCVKGSDTAEFLENVLAEIGLSEREANEFIIYWLPILQENPYNLISFQRDAYTSAAELEINPTPDSLLRVYMTAKPLDSYMEIEAQTFDSFERKGFTVVEWGGSIIE